MSDIKRIDIKEFRETGYLQELNRRFLHPLGLALEVLVAEDGTERLGGVWDYREDLEGIYFAGEYADLDDKAAAIDQQWQEREPARRAKLGYMVQPQKVADARD